MTVIENSEEKRLEELLFGTGKEEVLSKFNSLDQNTVETVDHVINGIVPDGEEDHDESLSGWVIDTVGNQPDDVNDGVSNRDSNDMKRKRPCQEEKATTTGIINQANSTVDGKKSKKTTTAAWSDEEDNQTMINIAKIKRARKLRQSEKETDITIGEYENRLRNYFSKNTPNWAAIPTHHDQDSEKSFHTLSSALGIQAKSKFNLAGILDPDHISMTRLKDANVDHYSKAVIQQAQFHPTAPVVMTAGYDKMIRLFQVNGKSSILLSSIHLQDFPIFSAEFTPSGKEIILTSRRKFFFSFDLKTGLMKKIHQVKGRDEKSWERMKVTPDNKYIVLFGTHGYIIFVSMGTKEFVATLKMNMEALDICFSSDGSVAYSIGTDGLIYQWDMVTKQCISTYLDHSVVHPTKIAMSKDNEYIAVGLKSGYVNIYHVKSTFKVVNQDDMVVSTNTQQSDFMERGAAIPIQYTKTIPNLRTAIHILEFHPSSSLLLISSRRKKDALKLVHLPSFRVYSNWPTSNTPLSYVNVTHFSPDGGYLVIGNDKGKVLMYEITALTGPAATMKKA